jgi:hypothetical protein
VGGDLTRVDLLGAVVVQDGGQGRGLGVQGDGRERRTVVPVATDQLRREVLRLRGTAAVARDEQPVPAAQPIGQLPAPSLRGPRQLGAAGGQGRDQRVDVGGAGGHAHGPRRGHGATAMDSASALRRRSRP